MISKITDMSAQSIQQYQKGENAKKDAEQTVAATSSTVSEKVNLSTKAKDIRHIKQILDQVPEVREDKISELKSKINSGTYTVQSDKIADKMAAESLIDIIV